MTGVKWEETLFGVINKMSRRGLESREKRFYEGFALTRSPVAGLLNLWNACPNWHAVFNVIPVLLLLLLPDRRIYTVKNMCIYAHISDTVRTEYELLLLPNNIAVKQFFTQIGAVRSVDWIFKNLK